MRLFIIGLNVLLLMGCSDMGLRNTESKWRVRTVQADVKNISDNSPAPTEVIIKVRQISLSEPIAIERVVEIPSLAEGQEHHFEESFTSESNSFNHFLRDAYRVDLRLKHFDYNVLNNFSMLPVFNSSLPIVIINTENTRIRKSTTIQARMDVIKNFPVFASTSLITSSISANKTINPEQTKYKTDDIKPVLFNSTISNSVVPELEVFQPNLQNYVTDKPNAYSGYIGIKIRGKSSSGFCKKQYKVETQFENGEDRKIPLLGMPVEEDWILHAPYSDKTLIRNRLVYSLWNKMGWYAPRTRFVEVLINRSALGEVSDNCVDKTNSFMIYLSSKKMAGFYEYNGLYLLVEKIKRDKNRVKVKKNEPNTVSEPELTGGYILKIDKSDAGEIKGTHFIESDRGTKVHFVYPKPGGGNNDINFVQSEWIEDYINEFETVIAGQGFTDPITGYRKYLDVESFVDFFLINQLFKNIDGLRISTYFHKDEGGKLTMGPVWDFNLSSGNANYCGGAGITGWYVGCGPDDYVVPFWWNRLIADPWFRQKLNQRWLSLRSTVFSSNNIMAEITKDTHLIKNASRRNFARWDILGKWIWPNNTFPDTYSEEITNFRSWLNNRLIWIDSNLPLLSSFSP